MIKISKDLFWTSNSPYKASVSLEKHGALLSSSASPDQTSLHFGEFNNPEYKKRRAMVVRYNVLRSEISGKCILDFNASDW